MAAPFSMNMSFMDIPSSSVVVMATFVGMKVPFFNHNHGMLNLGASNGNVGATSRYRRYQNQGGSGRENPSHMVSPLYPVEKIEGPGPYYI